MENSRTQEMIDALIARFFAAFDNRGVTPTLVNVMGCFTEKAVIVRGSSTDAEEFTVQEFAAPRIELLTSGKLLQFHEYEVRSTTNVFHNIATRTSRYGKSGLLDGRDYAGSGTKYFQLMNLKSEWRIASLLWIDDT